MRKLTFWTILLVALSPFSRAQSVIGAVGRGPNTPSACNFSQAQMFVNTGAVSPGLYLCGAGGTYVAASVGNAFFAVAGPAGTVKTFTFQNASSNVPSLVGASTAGGLPIFNDTSGTVLTNVADVATGQALMSGGVGANPAYSGAPSFTTSVTAPTVIGSTTLKSSSLQDTNGNPFLLSSATASAVDSVTITNAATANPATVAIGASGTDGNINLNLVAKGSGVVQAGGTQIALTGADINTSNQVTVTHLASPLPSAQGGTANGFFTVSGPATSAKTFTFQNASANVPSIVGASVANTIYKATDTTGTVLAATALTDNGSVVNSSEPITLGAGSSGTPSLQIGTSAGLYQSASGYLTSTAIFQNSAVNWELASGGLFLGNTAFMGFTSSANADAARDTAFNRVSAGVIGVNTSGAAGTAGTILADGNKVVLTADWTMGTGGTVTSAGPNIIGSGGGVPMTFTLPLVAKSYQIDCDFVVGQATAATANTWSWQTATNGATNVTASYSMNTAATAMTGGATTDTASTTTATAIGPNWTLGGTGTKMPVHIHLAIEGASASGTVASVLLTSGAVADLITIYRGGSCHLY